MSISEIALYKILKHKLGENETTSLIKFVDAEIKSGIKKESNDFMTKEDKTELIKQIGENKTGLIDRINKSKTETIIWIVGIGILQFILTVLSKKML